MRRLVLLVLLLLPATAQASAVTLETKVWDHLYDGGKDVVATDCYDGPDKPTTCDAWFNTRRQGCSRTFGERPFRPLTQRVCQDRKWRELTITFDELMDGIVVTP